MNQVGGNSTVDLSWSDRFVGSMTIKDWVHMGLLVVNVIALGVNIAALWFTGRSVRRQARATDLNGYFQIREQFSTAWRRFRDAEEENREFELTEIFGLFESACHLYNKRRLYGATRDMVRDFLCEMLPSVLSNEYAQCVFHKSISSPKTYSEIRRFARENKIEGVPQQ